MICGRVELLVDVGDCPEVVIETPVVDVTDVETEEVVVEEAIEVTGLCGVVGSPSYLAERKGSQSYTLKTAERQNSYTKL